MPHILKLRKEEQFSQVNPQSVVEEVFKYFIEVKNSHTTHILPTLTEVKAHKLATGIEIHHKRKYSFQNYK